MKNLFAILILFSVFQMSCDSTKKASGNDQANCPSIQLLENNKFNQLSSDNYSLETVRQEGKEIKIDVTTTSKIISSNIYWNGAIMKSYPPKTNVKIVVKTDGIPASETLNQTLCFDMNALKKSSDKIELYFLDDEETIMLEL